jgi:glycosyltransferase involved in cell wall biosynthesis
MTSTSTENQKPFVWAMGPFPPPVTGMTALTEKFVEGLQRKLSVRISNWSSGDDRQRPHKRALRVLRAVSCLTQLRMHGRVRNARLYITANNKAGLHLTRLLVKTGSRLGYTVYVHHHTYNYIDAFDPRMAAINECMGPSDVYVVHCPQMIEDFQRQYPVRCKFEYVYPSIVSMPLGRSRATLSSPLRLGLLANLTVEKGLGIVLSTFQALRAKSADVRLTLAGPCGTIEAERMIAAAIAKHPGFIEHFGPVFGERKQQFFDSIDCFLFPSHTESWGIVLNESLAAGVPVIATNRGCIRTLVGVRGGVVVDDPTQYVNLAVRQIEAWIANPNDYLAFSQSAIEQADYLHREAATQLDQVTSRICTSDVSAPLAGA